MKVFKKNHQLQKAEQFGAGRAAKTLARQWQQQDKQAADLRRLVEVARQQHDLSETRRLTLELLRQHPSNEASVGVTIPIKIESGDHTYLITDKEIALLLPCWVEVKPYGSKTITLQRDGRRSEFTISDQGSETVTLPAP